jgi:para-nitrobenzyl esterase
VLTALLMLTISFCSMATDAAGAAGSPQVRIATGLLHGRRQDEVDVFKGVPYAQPPVGPLRFRPPRPAARWNGVLAADRFGPACMQPLSASGMPNLGGYAGPTSEDCLTLNIWAPAGAKRAPVMVFIHGGANRFSASSFSFYDGTAFARDGVVLVSFNYRLGGLGYFAHPALTAEGGSHELLGNFALMDQIAALQWIQRNIAAFGGDPANVTLFGESSGANQTLWLMTVRSASALFQKAIVESAGGWIPPVTLREQEQQGVKLSELAGLQGSAATAAALRALPASAFLDPSFTFNFVPFIDGRLVTHTPTQAFAGSRFKGRPLMIGFNSFEGAVMPPGFLSQLGDRRSELAPLYPDNLTTDLSVRLLYGDQFAGASSRWIARRMATRTPAYLYRFSYVTEQRRAQTPGAPHFGEIPFVFDSWDRLGPLEAAVWQLLGAGAVPPGGGDRILTARVHGCWVAFARSGRPECPGGPAWPEYSAGGDPLMDFDVQPAIVNGVRKAQFDALERVLLPGIVNPGKL